MDKAPKGLVEKVTIDVVNIRLGYICVRNRTNMDDSIVIVGLREKELFESHTALKELDRTRVGIHALADKPTTIQSEMVKGCSPKIQKQMYEVLSKRSQQLNQFLKEVISSIEAKSILYTVLNKILTMLSHIVHGSSFVEFHDDIHLRFTAQCHEKFRNLLMCFTKLERSSGTNCK